MAKRVPSGKHIGLSVEVKGLRELERALNRLPEGVGGNFLAEALDDGAQVIVDEAKRIVPVVSGKLRDAIRTGNTRKNKFDASLDVGIDYTFRGGAVRYGHLVEFGTKRGARARPFMRPAFEQMRTKAVTVFKDRLWHRIQAVARRG